MWRVILLVYCYHVVSQSVTDEPSTRHTRELIECCPCPGSSDRSQLSRAMDDCPCKLRDADSVGSSSMLFPTRTEAGKSFNSVPFMRSNDLKDDMKNLLEPEVGLATSMLETLREATEEEYRDAVARDAARSSDAVPEESARNVVIFVKPRASDDDDGFVSEASNVKETRCIQPLGSMRSKPLRILPDLFRLPQARQPVMHRNLWDMDSNVGASNVQESIVGMNEGVSEKPGKPLFKLGTPLKENPLKSSMNGEGLKTLSVFDKLEQSLRNKPKRFERFNLPLIPKIKLDHPLRVVDKNIDTNSDLSPALSNVQELIEKEESKENGVFKFIKRPMLLKNLLKLKDVELIPKTTHKIPIFHSKLNNNNLSLPTSLNREADVKCEDSTPDSTVNEKQFMPKNKQTDENFEAQNVSNGDTGLQNNGENAAEFEEGYQDAITSPSEIIPMVIDNAQSNNIESDEIDCTLVTISSEDTNVSSDEIVRLNSDPLSKTLKEDNNSIETVDPTKLSEIENITENEEDNNVSEHCETEVSETANNNSEIDSSNNIVNMIPFTSQDTEDFISRPEFQEPGQDTINPLNNFDEDFTHIQSSEEESQRSEPSSTEINNNNIIPKIKPIPLSDTLSTIRVNVKNSLENLKKTTTNRSSAKLQEDRNSNILTTDDLDQEPRRDELYEEIGDSKSEVKETSDQVTFKDLQKLSDDLLVLSSNKDQNFTPKETNVEDKSSEFDFKSNEGKEQTKEVETDNLEDDSTNLPSKIAPKVASPKLTKEKACHIGIDEIKNKQKPVLQSKLVHQDEDRSVDTSAPTSDILPAFLDAESESDFKLNEVKEQPDAVESDSLKDSLTTLPRNETPKVASPKLTKEKACHIGFDEIKNQQKPVLQSKSVDKDEDMLVDASAPPANILPAFLDPLNLNEQLGSSLFQNLDPLNPLHLNENLGSPLLTNLDPLNLSEKLKSSLFSNIDPLNLNEKLRSPILADINPLNLNEKLGPSFPNFDPLNVRSSLQDIIVQPTIPDDPLILLGKPIAEVLKLPTFEDLRQRLSSVFDNNERSAENNFSNEDSDCPNDATEMASAASSTSLRKIPSIRPLEDLNVDIFQFNPLSSSQPHLLSKVPRLNLNNFRTKLPIPTNLDLKPVKLESTVGNNKGKVLGASLTFGNDRATSRKAKPIHPNLLGRPLGSLPSLDELRNTLHSGAQHLLGTPLQPKLDLFRDSNLRSSGIPDLDEIRRNAEKTMKGLQQKMKSTFKGGRINNPLSEKFAKPEDLLEDVNDKLKAIHYDLNDRLSSIHEDFLDHSELKSLATPARIPTFPSFSINRNPSRMNTIRKTKGKPARLQTSASTVSSQEINPLDNTNDRSLFQSQARNSLKRVQTQTHKTLAGAESSPVPTKVEFPKSRSTIDIPRKSPSPPLSQGLSSFRHSSGNILPESIRGKPLDLSRQTSFVKDLKRPILGKSNVFKDKTRKVTITFATTTPNPVTYSLEKYRTTPSIKQDKLSMSRPNGESLRERLAISRPKTTADAKLSATEFTPLRISTPLEPKTNFKSASSAMKNLPQMQSLEPIEDTKSSFKGINDSKMPKNNANRLNAAWEFDKNKPKDKMFKVIEKPTAKPLVWPKSGDNSFLAKVRDAMQARLASFDPTMAKKAAENVEITKVEKAESPNTDMMRSASENNNIMEAPLKESVPYKCRMICTRE